MFSVEGLGVWSSIWKGLKTALTNKRPVLNSKGFQTFARTEKTWKYFDKQLIFNFQRETSSKKAWAKLV